MSESTFIPDVWFRDLMMADVRREIREFMLLKRIEEAE